MNSFEVPSSTIDDLDISHSFEDNDERYFSEVVGHIEEIIMNENFQSIQQDFMEKHWTQFEDDEENRLIYTDIFKEYQNTVEKYIEKSLLEKMPHFDPNKFDEELSNRKFELEGEIFEMLSTFSNFISFKNMFIDYKKMKEEKLAELSFHISVLKYN
ncbi:unnamed protein product [Brassicogethes aeneus]|uniref:ADP-ribosylation factor-like protein 2-binding protein n=1 Tax=Brassicogethes aeneus TaxID=1431903 RepID=A0A9P0B768_BRAAE|nr:unnamed protein product [Brassicogethes aeneus]